MANYYFYPGKEKGFFSKLSFTTLFIIINVFLFIVANLLLLLDPSYIQFFALQPSAVFHGQYIWTLFTSMFFHVSFFHLLVNMISLFFIGSFVERILGKRRFLWFYLAAGIFASLFYATLSYFFGIDPFLSRIFVDPSLFALGASGAIFGLLGVLAILAPYNRVSLLAGPIIAIIIASIVQAIFPASSLASLLDFIVTLYFIVSLFAFFSFNPKLIKLVVPITLPFWLLPLIAIFPLVIIGLFVDLPIGNMAHLGGLLAGLFYGVYIRKRFKRKAKIIRTLFS